MSVLIEIVLVIFSCFLYNNKLFKQSVETRFYPARTVCESSFISWKQINRSYITRTMNYRHLHVDTCRYTNGKFCSVSQANTK